VEEPSFLIEALKRGIFISLIFSFLVGMLIITSMFRSALFAHERLWQMLGVEQHPLRPTILVSAAAFLVITAGILSDNPWVAGLGLFIACWGGVLYYTRPRPGLFDRPHDGR
jgi:hypothetical protein